MRINKEIRQYFLSHYTSIPKYSDTEKGKNLWTVKERRQLKEEDLDFSVVVFDFEIDTIYYANDDRLSEFNSWLYNIMRWRNKSRYADRECTLKSLAINTTAMSSMVS